MVAQVILIFVSFLRVVRVGSKGKGVIGFTGNAELERESQD